jgi:translation initiation factor SUI1
MNIQNMNDLNDLNDLNGLDSNKSFTVRLSVHQRNSKKYTTNVVGLPSYYDIPKVLRYIKKFFKCGGSVIKDPVTSNDVIQVTGDQRHNIKKFFIECDVVDKDSIIIVGF